MKLSLKVLMIALNLFSYLIDILSRYKYIVEAALDEILEVERQRAEYEEMELYAPHSIN
jgi:hypothetical protein